LMLATTLVPSGVMAQTSGSQASQDTQAAVAQSADTESDTGTGDSQQETCALPTFTINTAPDLTNTLYQASTSVRIKIGVTGVSNIKTAGYSIYYTTDGTDPQYPVSGTTQKATAAGVAVITTTNAKEQTTVTVKAIAVKDGYANSKIADTTVTFGSETMIKNSDTELYKALFDALDKPYDSETLLSSEDLATLETLDLSGKGLTLQNLSSLSYAVNLTTLDLSGNDLSAIKTADFKSALSGMKQLKTLNLSKCNIGTTGYGYGIPAFLKSVPVTLPALEVYNLSGNNLSGEFAIDLGSSDTLKTLDLSDNQLNLVSFGSPSVKQFPALASIDLSGNYIDWDLVVDGFSSFLENDVTIQRADQKNMATLPVIGVYSNGIVDSNSNGGFYLLNLGEDETSAALEEPIIGTSTKLVFNTYAQSSTVKVTVGDQKATAIGRENSTSQALKNSSYYLTVSDLKADAENTIDISVMYTSGETRNYTLKLTTVSMEEGSLETSAGVKDYNARLAICKKLGITKASEIKAHDITKEELAGLTGTLSIYNDITDVSWLQYATGLSNITIGTTTGYTNTFTSVPKLESKALTSLTLRSEGLKTSPDLSGLPNLTSLTISAAADKTYPSLASNTKITNLSLYDAKDGTYSLPEGVSDTSVNALYIYYASNADFTIKGLPESVSNKRVNIGYSAGSSVQLEDTSSISSITVEYNDTMDVSFGEGVTASALAYQFSNDTKPQISSTVSNLTELGTLTINGANSSGVSLSLPDGLSALSALTQLKIYSCNMKSYPSVLEKLTALKGFSMDSCNIGESTFSPDLSKLTSLTNLEITSCGLTAAPSPAKLPNSLEKLDLAANSISQLSGDWSGLTNLSHLGLYYNPFSQFPSETIKQIPSLKNLQIYGGTYAEIPAGTFTNSPNLTSLAIGSYIKCHALNAYSFAVDEGTETAKAIAELPENCAVSVVPYDRQLNTPTYSALQKIETSLGNITDLSLKDFTIYTDSGTTEITLTPQAILSDTAITINGKAVESGSSITLPLEEGQNQIAIQCENDYTNEVCTTSSSAYTMRVNVGDRLAVSDMKEGAYYSVGVSLKKAGLDKASMAGGYFTDTATVRYDGSRYEVRLKTTKLSWMNGFQYTMDGAKYDADILESDAAADTATIRIYTDSLEDVAKLTMFVVPMGYSPTCDVHFDLATIVDITDSIGVDTANLNAAINKALAITEGNNIYTDATFKALEKALADGQALLKKEGLTTAAADAMAGTIEDAIKALAEDPDKIADKSELGDLITQAGKADK
ncbi:NEAT domain-containing protein, partial [bacterium 210820-DFI.6.37]|nr:NEAT domain-containing protein [bacterium 210820-DFI.6.37]